MKKTISLFTIFITVFFTGIIYQNCSKSSSSAKSEQFRDRPEDVNVGGDGTSFVVNLSNGGHILYKTAVSDLNVHPSMAREDVVSSNLISVKFGHHFLENTISKDDDISIDTSCSESAFPHCLSVRERNEHQSVYGYLFVHDPLECHWQHRLSQNERTILLAYIQSIEHSSVTEAGTNQPTDNKCTLSTLSFNNGTESLSVVLNYDIYEDSVCLPSGTKYASSGNIGELKSFFEDEINELTAKKDDGGFCNNYSTYSANTTDWSYHSDSGYSFNPGFTNAKYNKENSTVSLLWREATTNRQIQCAENVSLQTDELAVFFPEEGLKYKFYYADSQSGRIVDLPNQDITYEDPFDGGNKWKFYKSEMLVRPIGGAVLQSSQMESIKNTIEGLINRAKSQSLLNANCPDSL